MKFSCPFSQKGHQPCAPNIGISFFVTRFMSLSVIVGFLLRIVLLFNHQTGKIPEFLSLIKVFGLGIVYDLCFSALTLIPLFVLYLGWTDKKYNQKIGLFIELLFTAAVIYVYGFHTIFHQYGGGAPLIAKIFFTYKWVSFSLRFFIPRIRNVWRMVSVQVLLFAYLFGLLLNATSEFFFWNEFGVRYNFIAVDYLIYTSEVLGNIFESYPIIPLFSLLVVVAFLVQWLIQRRGIFKGGSWNFGSLAKTLVLAGIGCFCAYGVLSFSKTAFQSENLYANELQSNGGYDFILAFQENKLNYEQFYPLLPKKECESIVQQMCHRNAQNMEVLSYEQPFTPKNIVLITVESLSADFLKAYGNEKNLTPHLDRLLQESLVFDSLYAVGNRTVRGLEAVSLCTPPTTGESIVKRPDNAGYFSVGSLLNRHGYRAQYLYGGDSYFDNMGTYFSGNGYDIIDKKQFSPSEITFSNIWGVCDEDIFNKAIQVMDKDAQTGQSAFLHIMTVSNHRPFTFPKGKITLDGDQKSREGGVKYTDYAIGKFLQDAARQPWFRNTVFVIVADHCASSAGETSIPIDNYHIPALVYSPGFIAPQRINKLCSQIDLMPTVLALLHLPYDSRFIGQNVLADDYLPRAFMATYQDMGYYRKGILTVLSPVKQIKQYRIQSVKGEATQQTLLTQPQPELAREAQAFYQMANMYHEKIK